MAKDKPRRKQVATMIETPERARHAAAVIDRPTGYAIGSPVGRLVQSPIDRLVARRSISSRMHSAGVTLRGQFETGMLGARDINEENVPGIRSTGLTLTPSEAQIDALSAYKDAMKAMGVYVGAVVVAVCCYEYDVSAVAEQQKRHRNKVMGVLEDGLKTLADHYRLTGRDDVAPDVDARCRHVA